MLAGAIGLGDQELAEPLGRDGVAEQVSLREVAAVLAEEIELLLGLDPLGYDLEL